MTDLPKIIRVQHKSIGKIDEMIDEKELRVRVTWAYPSKPFLWVFYPDGGAYCYCEGMYLADIAEGVL